MDLRVFTEPQQGATYDDLLAVAQRAEELGFDAFFRSDHYLAMGGDGLPGPTDAWMTLAGAGPRDLDDPARHADDVGDLPAARPAGDRGRAGRPDERRPGRARARRRLVRGRARRVRHPVPDDRRALRPARGAARGHHRAVGHPGRRALRLRRRALPGHRLPRAAQAGAAPRPADRSIGGKGKQRTPGARGAATPTSSTCRSTRSTHPRAVRPGPDGVRGRPAATPTSWCTPTRWCSASGRTRPSSPAAPPPSAARSTSSARTAWPAPRRRSSTGSASTPPTGSTRIYLQMLDLADLDHLDLVAAEVMPHV